VSRDEVFKLIDGERVYQDGKWPKPKHAHSPQEYLSYIETYAEQGRVTGSMEDNETAIPKQQVILRKIAALAVAAMEEHGAPAR
jgi:hypothetical protein